MNPTVATMLRLVMLENSLNADCECESPTHDDGRVACSGDAAYRIHFACRPAVNVCTLMGRHALKLVARRATVCNKCRYPIEVCWTVRPI